jgi:uncharacterized Zn finger protein
MSFNYTPLSDSADRLIKRFGKSYTFTRTAKGTYDPATGTTTDTTSTFTKFACVFNYSESEVNGEAVLQSDRRLLAQAHTYQVGDTVVVDGETFRVISIAPTQPSDTAMAINLQVRK